MKQEIIKLIALLEREAKECLNSKTGDAEEDAYMEGSSDAFEHAVEMLKITLERD